ncbi:MAG: DUF697 domain-containing protein [Lentisphaerae bacterium]|nr:DUF697 domain-containing protein [Lentisphaerota bacterium]
MLRSLWKSILFAAWVIGILLTFFALIELLRAYQTLRDVHPALGWAFAGLLVLGIAWTTAYYVVSVVRRPSLLVPPAKCDLDKAGTSEVLAYGKYLAKVTARLSQNDLIPDSRKDILKKEEAELRGRLKATTAREPLRDAVRHVESAVIQPAMEILDEQADKQVRTCVRDVMVGVAVSPWRAVDLLVVLYRNGAMALHITHIYNSRPRLREQARIAVDVLKVVAAVNFINYGKKVLENLFSFIPFVGRAVDDIAQGIGAGLFTSVAGHATLDRCRSFRGWNEAEATSKIRIQLKDFGSDLAGIARDVVAPAMRQRLEAEIPEENRGPDFMNRVKSGITEAVNRTGEVVDSYVRIPVFATGERTLTTVILGGLRKGAQGTWRGTAWTADKAGRGAWAGAKLAAGMAKAGARGIKKVTSRMRNSRKPQDPPAPTAR